MSDDPLPGPSGIGRERAVDTDSDSDSESDRPMQITRPMQSSSDSDNDGDTREGRRRRKVAKPSEWKKFSSKRKRNEGKEYVSVRSGKTIEARKVGEPCGCKSKCFDLVTMPVIKEVFDDFWAIGEYNLQNEYLSKLMSSKIVKRRRKPVEQAEKFRRHSVAYNIIYKNEAIPVCKTAFHRIFGLGAGRFRHVQNKEAKTGVVEKDRRGTVTHARKIPTEAVDVIREHINTLPAVSSHYCRAKSKERKYLTPDLTVPKLYALYADYASEHHPDVQVVKEWKYREVFKTVEADYADEHEVEDNVLDYV